MNGPRRANRKIYQVGFDGCARYSAECMNVHKRENRCFLNSGGTVIMFIAPSAVFAVLGFFIYKE